MSERENEENSQHKYTILIGLILFFVGRISD